MPGPFNHTPPYTPRQNNHTPPWHYQIFEQEHGCVLPNGAYNNPQGIKN